jgi:hypothetical protein
MKKSEQLALTVLIEAGLLVENGGGYLWIGPNQKDLTPPKANGQRNPMTPLQAVMRAYKVAKGIAADDATWDKANWKVHCRAGAKLLDAFKGVDERAVMYLLGKAQEWNEAGITWVLATIAKHAHDDRGKHEQAGGGAGDGEQLGPPRQQVGADRVLERRGPGRIAQAGSLADETLRQIGHRVRSRDDGGDQSAESDHSVLGSED